MSPRGARVVGRSETVPAQSEGHHEFEDNLGRGRAPPAGAGTDPRPP